jgi:hypothetical protein
MSIISTETVPFVLMNDGTIIIHEATTQTDWTAMHSKLIHAKRYAAGWLKQSREFATTRWGIEFVADAEVQMEMDLGIEMKEKPAALNPADKSKAIVNIEGIHQSFILWERKMHDEIETWGQDKLTRALELLEPMERQARAIRDRLNAGAF